MPCASLRATRLGVRYLARRAAALRDLNIEIDAGDRGLVGGASGSGKSTLALCVAGLIPASIDADLEGEVHVGNRPTTSFAAGELARHVGIVFQDPASQFTMLTVGDEVAFGLENIGLERSVMRSRVSEALAAVGLDDRESWRIDRLSGGQQQRVVLAAALAMRPAMLVLDEPTAHLDPRAGTEFYQHLRRVADDGETTLVIIEHDADKVVPALARRCLLLGREGGLLADRPTREMFGSAGHARAWRAAGLHLPTASALALALEDERLDLPIDVAAAVEWLTRSPGAQDRLRRARLARRERDCGDVVLNARGVRQRYRTPYGDQPVLRGVDLTVRDGEFVAVVGRNGSGKTTLLRALSGLVKIEGGTVRIEGQDVAASNWRAVASLVNHVFQDPERGFVAATVADELTFSPRALGWREEAIDHRVGQALERYGLAAVARANPYTLSGGQKRRLSVAAALIAEPRVVLLDEPTFGQDRRSARALLDDLACLQAEGLAVVAATHDPSVIAEEADRVVALVDGTIAFDGRPGDFLADDRLLALTGQEPPPLRRILARAREAGADVPIDLRWRDFEAVVATEPASVSAVR